MSNRTIEAILKISSKLGDMRALRTLQGEMRKVDGQAKAFNRANAVMAGSVRSAWAATARYVGPAVIAYGAKRAVTEFAGVERRLNRIAVNAGEGKEAVGDMLSTINKASRDYAMSQDQVSAGLETLVAAGRDAKDAMTFLPAITATAQAAGAEITDIATTADAVSNSFGIAGDKMQKAFDILVTSGKQGKFELKDMAQYLPSLAPAFSALGYKGEKGLGKLASMLQTIRIRTGDASEAATAAQNVIQKMESTETAKKFSKFGVDLRKEMAKARKEGKDLVEVFLDLTEKATKGDLSKIPQIFNDAQVQIGMRALMQGRKEMQEFERSLQNVDGATLKDLGQVLSDTQSKVDKMSSSFSQAFLSLGGVLADVLNPGLDRLNTHLDQSAALELGMEKRGLSNSEKWRLRMMGSAQERGLIMYQAGWRSDAGKLAAKGTPDVNPELPSRRNDGAYQSTNSLPQTMRVPGARPARGYEYLSDLQYNRFTPPSPERMRQQLDAEAAAATAPAAPTSTGIHAAMGLDPKSMEDALANGGQSIEQAARAINEQAKEGGSAFRTMLEGMGKQIGTEAAQAFKANLGTVTVNARVNADVGRAGADVDAGGPN